MPKLLSKIIVRPHLYIGFLVVLLGLLELSPRLTMAQVTPATVSQQRRQISFRNQLTVGLKARTKADLAFVEKVISAVEQAKLPRTMVDSTFLWARKRAARHSYRRQLRPMVYFQPALTQRALAIGLKL